MSWRRPLVILHRDIGYLCAGLIFQMNFLHLKHGKGVWTWVADVYAVALLLLAVSGAVILRGPRGFEGRGKWLVLAGLVIPLVFLWWKT